MKTIGDRIRSARVSARKTQRDVAEYLGIDRVSVTQWEGPRGHGPDRTRLPALASYLGTTVEWLLEGKGAGPNAAPGTERPKVNANIGSKLENAGEWRSIPVYGQAVGGVDGRFILNGNKIADVLAPPAVNAADAYAVYVVGESMEPRYFAGETIYVHPRMPVRRNDFVVVQLRGSEENERLGYVKQFVSMDDKRLRLRQFNPAKDLEFPRRDVVSVHKIVLAG